MVWEAKAGTGPGSPVRKAAANGAGRRIESASVRLGRPRIRASAWARRSSS